MSPTNKNSAIVRLKLVFAAIICFIIIGVSGFQFLRWDLARCYEMPPWEFHKQAKLIRQGMTEEEAIGQIKGYTEIRRQEGSTLLIMRPQKKARIVLAISQWIQLQLDQTGRVISVFCGDG